MKEEIDLNIEDCVDLESCINWVMALHEGQEVFLEWLELPEEHFIGQTHHNFGRWLRNTLELWHNGPPVKYFNDLGIYHADDISVIILTSVYRKYHGINLNLQDQIKRYRDYWEKTDPKVNQGIKE